MTNYSRQCPVCNNQLSGGYQTWHFICNACSYEQSDLKPTINTLESHKLIKEDERAMGLRDLRVENFKKLLKTIKQIKQIKPKEESLLDVGCAHGWFLEVVGNDFNASGLEPDEKIFYETSRRGLPIRIGYFPDALNDSEKFDVIVFNDVIEHIPDIKKVIVSCYQRLNHNGLLVLNLPSSNGVLYRLSKFFSQLGLQCFFERLWQKGLPSPHLHYFNLSNITKLLSNNGFNLKANGRLETVGLSGLYTRIAYTGSPSISKNVLMYVLLVLCLPILKLLPSDIFYVIFTPKALS